MAKTLSGPTWVSKFPNSIKTNHLAEPFRSNAKKFIAALKAAGATVTVNATVRPKERAFLMHWSFKVARKGKDPETVPELAGVEIDWVHRNLAGQKDAPASKAAAGLMVAGYGIAFPPVIDSRHTAGTAIDMDISWTTAALTIKDGTGANVIIKTGSRNGGNTKLHRVGASYGVIKLISDPPHWSSDGH